MVINVNSSKYEVMNAVRKNGMTLFDANPEFQHDKEIILAAINQNVDVLYRLDRDYYDDKEIILAAIKKDKDCFFARDIISPRLLKDFDVCMALVKRNGLMFEYILIPFFDPRYEELASAAIKENPYAFELLDPIYQDNYDLALLAVSEDGLLLKSVSPRLKENKDIVLAAVKCSQSALRFTTNPKFYYDIDIINALSDKNVRFSSVESQIESEVDTNSTIEKENVKKSDLLDKLNDCLKERKKLMQESARLDDLISKKMKLINSIGGKNNGRK